MAKDGLRIQKSIGLKPQTSAPTSPTNGDIYYDSTLKKLRSYVDGSWKNISDLGNITIGTIDSQSKVADGATISADQLYLQTADVTYPGLVSTAAQSFIGQKTFTSAAVFSGADLADLVRLTTGNSPGDSYASIRGDNEAGIRIRGGGSSRGGEIELAGGSRDTDPGVIKFLINNSEKMKLDTAGNFGIGTSSLSSKFTVDFDSASNALHEVASFHADKDQAAGSSLIISANRDLTGTSRFAQIQVKDGSATNRSLILQPDGGNLGIGTTSPETDLHIEDATTTNVLIRSTGSGASLEIDRSSTVTDSIIEFSSAGANQWRVGMDSAGAGITNSFEIKTTNNAAPEFVISPAGNVGVGVSSPTGRINGLVPQGWNSSNFGFTFENEDTSTTQGNTVLIRGGANHANSSTLAVRDVSGNTDFLVRGDGNVGVRTATPSTVLQVNGSFSMTSSQGLGAATTYSAIGISYFTRASGSTTIDTITGGVNGQIIWIINTSTGSSLTLSHNASATDSILIDGSVDRTYTGYGVVCLVKQGVRWFVVQGSAH